MSALQDRWLLPEGIDEALPCEAERIERLHRQLVDLFYRWGYELVVPPLIEYLESLLTGAGHDLDLQTFKLTDQLTGRLMGVRADITPQVARIEAHRLGRLQPVRLCYIGPVLHTRPEAPGGTRSPLQMGAELYGHAGIESDAEIVRLMLEALRVAGIAEVHLDLGHVGIFRGLARQAMLSEEHEAALFDALQRKARPEIEQLLERIDCGPDVARMLVALADLNGDHAVLTEAQAALHGASTEVQNALRDLGRLAASLRRLESAVPVHFDLAELRGYRYHTGVVFASYVPGLGQAVAQGGRYDDIGRVFGRARPATGFSGDMKTLIGLQPNAPRSPTGIFAPFSEDPALRALTDELRRRGERVVSALPGQSGGAREMGCDRELFHGQGAWRIKALEG